MISERQLDRIVSSITDNYEKEELFSAKKNCQMPNRDTIIHVIMGIRQVMFPGYFDEESLCRTISSYFVGHKITWLYDTLQRQILYALQQAAAGGGDEFAQSEEDIDNIKQPCKEMMNDALHKGKCGEVYLEKKSSEMCTRLFESLADIQKMIMKDIDAAYNGDPAAKTKEEIIFCYPGLFAIFVYRIAHELYKMDVPFIPRIMSEYAHGHTGIDINPGADIGEYFFIDHGTGVVIGETTKIGNNVKIYQGVTLGALSTRSGQLLRNVKRHPTIEDNVTIYSSASILGGETVIGEGSVIGGNAFITESVPAGTKVSVKVPELCFTERETGQKIFE